MLFSPTGFEMAQRMATALSKSTLIPKDFQDNLPNCLIALEMAHRMGASPMMVMQNLYIVHGKPAWSSQFVIAAINSTGKFSPLRFAISGTGDDKQCVAWAIEKGTQERLESPPVSIGMAKKEGWYGKNGSKWQTLPELMLRYRSATFFGRLYAPEVLMGMKEETEVIDVDARVVTGPTIEEPVFARVEDPDPNQPRTEPEATEKPKRKKKEAAEPPATDESPLTQKGRMDLSRSLLEKIGSSGYSVEQVIEVAIENVWIEPSQDLDNMPDKKLQEFNDNWPAVIALLEAKFPKA